MKTQFLNLFKKNYKHILALLFLIIFFGLIYKLYIPRINAFGCFDDCFNLMGGYFLSEGKSIYRDFYFNHQPGMAFASLLIQTISNPQSIAELILSHRQFVIFFSLISSLLLYLRFGFKIIIAVIFYELVKFYIFGDRFLAEGIVVYLAAYQISTVLSSRKSLTFTPDLIIMPLISWLIFYLREPFAPFAFIILLIYYIQLQNRSKILKSCAFFITIILSTFILISPKDYIFNVYQINNYVFSSEIKSLNIEALFKILLSPLNVLVAPESWNLIRIFLAFFSIIYLISILYIFYKLKNYKLVLLTLFLLAITNLRPAPVSMQFFEAFHSIVWIFCLILIVVYLVNYLYNKNLRIYLFLISLLILNLIILVSNKNYFAYEKVNTNEEFFTNFSYVMDVGTTIRNLSSVKDTIFVDGYDDLILWESKLKSSYKYGWYTSFMNQFDIYSKERERMFDVNPPAFYYGYCIDNFSKNNGKLDKFITSSYTQITDNRSRGCILIINKKLKEITSEQWNKIDKSKYYPRKIQKS